MKNFFLPHSDNKKRSILLQPHLLLTYCFFAAALLLSNYFIVQGVRGVLGYATNVDISDLLKYTNLKREESGLGNLKLNPVLSKAAEQKANDMFANDYWAHVSPGGKEPWDFINAVGYDYSYAGENLAVDFSESKNIVQAWYDSQSHRDNLINSNYIEVGFAVVNGELQGRKTTLVVQMFGRPRFTEGLYTALAPESEPGISTRGVSIETAVEIPAEKELESPAVPAEALSLLPAPISPVSGEVLNASNVFDFSRFLAILLGLFLSALFAIDGYYVRKMGVLRVSGHTFLHITILVLAIAGIWYTSIGLIL